MRRLLFEVDGEAQNTSALIVSIVIFIFSALVFAAMLIRVFWPAVAAWVKGLF